MAADAAAETPTVPSSILTITDVKTYPADGSHLYDVVYSVATKNSASRPVTITYSIAELYVGVPRQDVSLGLRQGYALEEPPTPWDAAGPGAIDWTRVYYDASWVDGGPPPAVKAFFAAHCLMDTSDGTGLTGALAPGDSTGTRPEFFVRAMPGDYIGVVVSYGLGDAVTSPSSNINLTEDYLRAPGAAGRSTGADRATPKPDKPCRRERP